MLTYGLAEVGYRAITELYDIVNKTTEFATPKPRRLVYFSEISTEAERIFKETYDSWIKDLQGASGASVDPADRIFTTGFILAGFDANESNQFKVMAWESPKFTRLERPDIIAAQWNVSQYLVNNFYFPEMTVETLKRLAVFLLVETGIVSPTVGGQLQIATVTLENGFQRLNEHEVQSLIEENQPRFAEFRRIMLGEFT